MAFYRLYSFRNGYILSGRDIIADDDQKAVAVAELDHPLRDRELWYGGRLVWSLLAPIRSRRKFRLSSVLRAARFGWDAAIVRRFRASRQRSETDKRS